MDTIDNTLHIRLMEGKSEKKAVKNVMKKCFPPIQQLFFSFSSNVLVAEKKNEITGAIVLNLIKLPKNKKGGFISWLFTSPEHRRLAIGQKLIEEALHFFKENNCDEIFACVEGFNTSSSNLFKSLGFSTLSPGEQIKRYGARFLEVWFKIFHFIDVGFFIWAYPNNKKPDKPKMQFVGNILINSGILLLSLWRWNSFLTFNPHFFYIIPISIFLIFFIRELILRLRLRVSGISMRFRPWESGFFMSLLIALLFGYYYPIPGSIYPKCDEWKYRDIKNKLGFGAFLSSLFLLLVLWILSFIIPLFSLSSEIHLWLITIRMIISPLIVFDILIPIFPFSCFNGRRVWDWNHYVWIILALTTIISIIFLL